MWVVVSIKAMLLVSITLSSILLFSGGSFGEEDEDIPIIAVRFDQKEKHVQVFFDENGTANYTGEIMAQIPYCPDFQYVIVDLSFNVDRGWAVNGTSRVLFTKGGSTQPFHCMVTVPKRTSFNGTGILSVQVQWRTEPEWNNGNTTDSAAIYVDRFSKLIVFVEERSQTVGKDEIAEFRVFVRNDGNFREYLGIDFGGDDAVMIEHDFPEHLYLEEGENINFSVRARCTEEGTKDIFMIVYSKYGYRTGWTNNTLRIDVKYDLMDSIAEDPINIIVFSSFIVAVGVGVLVIMWVRTKGFLKRYQ